ncbi:hypothetical protein CDIK_3764, partial [Cucumispora dikerogammari]
MEEQFEKKFIDLVNEKFLEIEKEGEIEIDKFTEAVDLDTRPTFFDEINEVLQELFFFELILFCYEYFSEIKHMILKSEKSVLEKCTSFFQRDLKILNEITHYKHTPFYSDFICIKNFDSHFSYLLYRLEQIVLDRTNLSTGGMRACLYYKFDISVDINNDLSIQDVYHNVICFFKYSTFPQTFSRNITPELKDCDIYYLLNNIRNNVEKLDITVEYNEWFFFDIASSDLSDTRYNKYEEHRDDFLGCCYEKNKNLYKCQCEKHNKQLIEIKNGFFAYCLESWFYSD